MAFSEAFEDHPLIERALRVRRIPTAAYGVALAAVAFATLMRWFVGDVVHGIPFATYYPAIIIATLFGGFWPGMLATALSSIAAAYFFLPPLFDTGVDQRTVVSLLLFVSICGVNVFIVALLNAAIARFIDQVGNARILFESAPIGIVVVDEKGSIELVNRAAEEQFGYARSDLVGQKIEVLVPARQVALHRGLRESFLRRPEARAMGGGGDLSGRRKNGSEFPVEIGLNPIRQDGRTAIVATVIDISDRKMAEEGQKFIFRELQHRTQNLFSVFQAIASRTVDESKTAAEIKYVLNGRLQALARAYDMAADAAWEGVSLAAILNRALAGFSKHVCVNGCEIVLNPSAAQQFALIVHELATNALKYGALSAPDGRVSIEGKIARHDGDGTFSFVWRETGGPPADAPARKGFGTVILLDSAKQFGHSAVLDYTRQGLRYELQLQLGAIEASKSLGRPESRAPLDGIQPDLLDSR